jgi:hypothetical protein
MVARAGLGGGDALAMYRLLARHFEGVDEPGFRADLADKDWIVLLDDGRGELVGFSTLRLDRERHDGHTFTVVYSGDTIVDPRGWGTTALARTWIRSVRALHETRGEGPLLWLLLTSGFRTYRFLPVFCRVFHSGPGPPDQGGLGGVAARLARRRFGAAYDPARGVVRLPRPQRLRDPLLDIPAGRLSDPHVRRFVRLNPGHAAGDELVSLAPLDDDNLTRAGLRMLHGSRIAS